MKKNILILIIAVIGTLTSCNNYDPNYRPQTQQTPVYVEQPPVVYVPTPVQPRIVSEPVITTTTTKKIVSTTQPVTTTVTYKAETPNYSNKSTSVENPSTSQRSFTETDRSKPIKSSYGSGATITAEKPAPKPASTPTASTPKPATRSFGSNKSSFGKKK